MTVVLALWAAGGCRRAGGPPALGYACPGEIRADQLWAENTEAEINQRLAQATACAQRRGARVLLEFVATWCDDCQAMTQLEQLPTVATVLRERYERVRVNVGRWDRPSEALRERYGIHRIAAYVVLDPATGRTVAQRVVEPVTGNTAMTPELWAGWLRAPE